MIRSSLGLLVLALLALPAPAAKATTISAGTLQCEVSGSIAFIVRSTREVHCVFYKVGGPNEAYDGTLREFGLDIGATGRGLMVWEVLAPTRDLPPGELAGTYSGLEAGGEVVIGGSVRALVGGSGRTISLQPLSVEASAGLNLAVGIASLRLTPHPVHRQVAAAPTGAAAPRPLAPTHYGCGSYVHITSGQTLYGIAHMCGVTLEALLEANPEIRNVRSLRVGETVAIPSHVGHHGSSPCGTRAILDDRERLEELAWRCGVTLHALLAANRDLRDAADVAGGLVLRVPSPTAGGAPVVVAAADPAPAAPAADDHTHPADHADALSGGPDYWEVVGVEVGHALNVRAGPSTAEAIVIRVPGGTILANRGCLMADGERWCAIETVDGRGGRGFVSGAFLAEGAAPAAARPPSRTPGPAAVVPAATETQPVAAAPADDEPRRIEVRFPRGETATTIEDRITGLEGVDYVVRASAGQTMAVTLQAAGVAYFNVLPPGGEAWDALFVGSREGDAFEQALTESGAYTIRVYLMGGDRDEGRTVPYRLNVSVVGEATPTRASAPAPARDGVERRRVRFAAGEASALVDGAIVGPQVIDYVLGAAEGQRMRVVIDGDAFFNVLPPGSDDVAIFNGSARPEGFVGTLEESGDYVIRVYTMGEARDSGRTVPFTLDMEIAQTGEAHTAATGDVAHPDSGFHATGQILCARDASADMDWCDYGVVRRGVGTADVTVYWPDGGTRVIFFENGEAIGFDAAEADAGVGLSAANTAAGDYFVTIGEAEFEIPEAVVFGG